MHYILNIQVSVNDRNSSQKIERVYITKFDIYVLLLSLGQYFGWWTISPRGYHQPSSQCFGTDMVYKGNNKITELRTILQRESQNS